ncbi:ABC-three component system middle component 6 [Vibrio splendidus]|uniref:ABC-three component system middle component 6 n=1 Tax=Vibrio splendidus TaxID=29497 RepID=UPI000C847A24|nr:ABC-three component system middle component 6 [Vibrio splendidus]MCC4881591.1 hypothetical protein [Vibrio splendidus]PMO24550.1 hypothetical protein BCT15_05890 [Vibrio splendidus]
MITLDSDPTLNPVNIGAMILTSISESDYTEVKIQDLYYLVKKEFGASYDVFAYTLDWLYIIGAINLSEDGLIEHATN